MTTPEQNPLVEFELSHPREAAALWTHLTDGTRLTVTTSEAATLYRELVLQRLASPDAAGAPGAGVRLRGADPRGVSDPGALDRV